jgi:hypothetical protein
MSTQFEEAPTTGTIPWETDLSDRPAEAAWETWRRSLFEPVRFFRGAEPRGPLGFPIGYAVVFALIGAAFTLGWRLVAGAAGLQWGASAGPLGPVGGALIEFFLTPFVTVIGLFIWAGLVHLMLMILQGSGGGFRATLRAHAYSAGPAVFNVIPFLGTLVAAIWSVVIAVVGLREMHRIETWKAVVAILLPIAVIVVFAVVVAVIAGLTALLL